MIFSLFGRGLAIAILTLAIPVTAAFAQTDDPGDGLVAGSFLVRGRVVGVLPKNGSTTITVIGGQLNNSNSVTPEVDISYFFTNHLAIEGETGYLHTNLSAQNTMLGTISVGSVSSIPVVLVPQYHPRPFDRLYPYVGIGLAILPYFDADPAGGPVQQLSVSSEVGAVFQFGVDYRVTGPWYANFDVKKLILAAHATVDDGAITASGQVNPWIIGAGLGYRF